MAYPGQILDNLVSGERMGFRKTAAETCGRSLTLKLVVAVAIVGGPLGYL